MYNENGGRVDETRDILQEIANKTRERTRARQEILPLAQLKKQAEALPKGAFTFEKALCGEGSAFICEVKKASPSKGIIAPYFPYLEIAKEYEAAGASAISCLTEPCYFQGRDSYLKEIAETVTIPVLRKDFFVDGYMVYEAKVLGASAILLICALLKDEELREYFQIAETLGLSTLFEAHDEEEVARAIACGARVIGVNNRNLKTFQTDLQHSVRLRGLVPAHIRFISESGIKTREDMALLESCGVDGVLIGETFMRSPEKKKMLEALRGR